MLIATSRRLEVEASDPSPWPVRLVLESNAGPVALRLTPNGAALLSVQLDNAARACGYDPKRGA